MFAALITANSAASFRVNSICLRERAVSCDCKGGREMWEGKKKKKKEKEGTVLGVSYEVSLSD